MSKDEEHTTPSARQRAKRVMLIGWEGADWRLMEPLLDAGLMPHVERIIDTGTMGNLTSLIPMICPILWTSIATGVFGDRHEILTPVEPDGYGDVRPVQSTSRRRKAIWNILNQSGLRSAVVGWPATHPAEPINGVVVSDRFPHTSGPAADLWPVARQTIHPPELADRITDLLVRTEDLTPGQIASFIPRLKEVSRRRDPRVASVAMRLAQAASIQNAATWIAQKTEWDFLAVHFGMLGGLCHEFIKYKSPHETTVSETDAAVYGGVVDTAYILCDRMLGRLRDIAGEETLLLLVSDHGFNRTPIRLVPGQLEPVMDSLSNDPRYHYLRYHRRDAVFCAAGPGVKEDDIIVGGRITDIAPTILAALGLPVPADTDGRVLEDIWKSPSDVATVESYESPAAGDGVHNGDLTADPWVTQEIVENLSALGFVHLEPDRASALEACSQQRQLNLAETHMYWGRIDEALGILRRLVERDDSFSVRVPIIRCLIDSNQLEEAEEELKSVALLLPHSATPKLLWAMLYAARGNLEMAESYIDRAKDAAAPPDDVLLQLGALALRLRRWDKAKTFFERALDNDPLLAGAHDGLGQALLRLDRIEEAVSHHMRAVQLLYKAGWAHQHLGEALVAAGQLDRAVRAFETALELDPKNTRATRHLNRTRRFLEEPWRLKIDASTDNVEGDPA
ncbi:MAG: alkaline phosphatase family protein [Anaerolineales bacterium]